MSLVDLYVKELLMQQKLGREFQYHQHQQQQQQHSPQPQPFLPPSQPIGPHQQMQQISSSTPSSSSSSSTSSQFYVNQQTQRHQQRPFFSSKTAILQQCPPPTMFDPFAAAAAVAANFMQQQSFAAPTQQPFPAMASAFYGMGSEGVPFQQQQMAPNYSYFPPFGFGFPLANFTHSPSCGSLNSTGSCVSLDSFTSSPDSNSSCGSASSLNGLNGPPFPLNGGRTPQTTIAADNANHNQLPKRQFPQQGTPQTARRPTAAAAKSRVQQQQQPSAAAPTDFSELAALIAAAPTPKDSKSGGDGGGVNGKRAEHFLLGQPTAQKTAQKVFTTKAAAATAAKSQKRPQQQQQQPKLQQIQQQQQQQGHMGGKSMFFHVPAQQQQQKRQPAPGNGNGIGEEPPKKMARKLGATIFVPMERFGALGLGKVNSSNSSNGFPSTEQQPSQMHFGTNNSCVQQQKTTNAAAAASSRPVAVRTPVTSTTQTQTSSSPAAAQMATSFDVPSHKLAAMPMPTAAGDKDRKEEKDGRKKEHGTNNKMGMAAQTASPQTTSLSTILLDSLSSASACDGQKNDGGMPEEEKEEGMGVLPKRAEGNAMLDVENELKAGSPLLLFDPILLGQMAAAKENAQKEATKQTEDKEQATEKMKKKKTMKRTLEEKRGNDEEKTEKKKKKKKVATDSEKSPMKKKMKPLAKQLKAVAANNVLTTADLAAAVKEEENGGQESGGMPWKEKKPVGIQSSKSSESRGGSFLGGDRKADQGKENPPRLVVEVKVEIGSSASASLELESSAAEEVCVHQADLLGKVAEEEKEEKEEENDQLEVDDDNDEEEGKEEEEEEHMDKTAISCRWTKCKERFVDQDSLYDHLASAHIEPLKKWVLAERRELEQQQRKAGGGLKRRRSNGGATTAAEVKERFRCRWRQCEQFTRRGDAQKKLDWLLQHLVIRHAPKARPFTCLFTGCALRFPKVQSLNDHLRSAHDDTNGGRNCGRKCASEEVKVSCFEFRTRVHLPIVSDCIDARTIEWIRCRQDADSYPHMKEVHQSHQQPAAAKHTSTSQIGRAKARKIICPRGTSIRDQHQQQRVAFNVKLECAAENGVVEMKQEVNGSCQPRMPIKETIKLVKGLFNTRKRRRLHRPKH